MLEKFSIPGDLASLSYVDLTDPARRDQEINRLLRTIRPELPSDAHAVAKGAKPYVGTSQGNQPMEYEQLILTAKDAVGEGDKDDYVLAPTRHAEELARTTPALARILRSSEVSTVARLYEEKDVEAGEAQISFKRTANRANWAVLLTACFSAALSMTAPFTVGSMGEVKGLQVLLGGCGIASARAGLHVAVQGRGGQFA